MAKVTLADVLEMPVAERILLVEDIWDSIAAIPEAIPLTAAQREELDRRLDDYHAHRTAGVPWDEVKSRIRNRS
ncbi:MAG: addiction module protein [Armatimonadota bacterium]